MGLGSCFYRNMEKEEEYSRLMEVIYSLFRELSWQLLDDAFTLEASLSDISAAKSGQVQIARILMELLTECGYETTLDDAGNVAGLIRGRGEGNSILLLSHLNLNCAGRKSYDTAAGKKRSSRPGNTAHSEKNRCGASLAAQFMAGLLIKKSRIPLDGDLIVASTVVEDGGICPGVQTLMEETLPYLECRPKLAMIAAPTSLRVLLSHAGRIDIDVIVNGDSPFSVHEAAWSIATDLRRFKPCGTSPEQAGDLIIEAPILNLCNGHPKATIRLSIRVQISENMHNMYAQIKDHVLLIAGTFSGIRAACRIRRQRYKLYTGKAFTVLRAFEPWYLDWFDPELNRLIIPLLNNRCALSMGRRRLESPCVHMAASILVNDYNIPTLCYGPDCDNFPVSDREKKKTDQMGRGVLGMALLIYEVAGSPIIEWKI